MSAGADGRLRPAAHPAGADQPGRQRDPLQPGGDARICVELSIEPAAAIAARHPAYRRRRTADSRTSTSALALIAVHDQGAGISDEQLSRLFKRYARGRERRGEGLGLGLYLSREFVARHGGDIWAESREGQGSTFYVTLPLENERTNGVENI